MVLRLWSLACVWKCNDIRGDLRIVMLCIIWFADMIDFDCELFCCLYLQAAAAMCVGIGSFSDPNEAQGLAHFLGLDVYLIQAKLYFIFLLIFSRWISILNHEFLVIVLQNTCSSWGVMNFQMKMRYFFAISCFVYMYLENDRTLFVYRGNR